MTVYKKYILFILLALSIISIPILFFITNNNNFQVGYQAVFADIEYSEASGMDVSELKLQLEKLKENKVAYVLDEAWLGPLTNSEEKLQEISQLNENRYNELISDLKRTAELYLEELQRAEATHNLDHSESRLALLAEAKTPNEISQLIEELQLELEEWNSNLAKLSLLSDGLIDDQPQDIKTLEVELNSYLDKLSDESDHIIIQGIEGKIEDFYEKHPQEQISLHAALKENLITSIQELKSIFFHEQIINILKDKVNVVSVAIYDHKTGYQFSYNGDQAYYTASTLKTKLLAGILYDLNINSRALTETEESLISPMIIESDNYSTSTLWRYDGGKEKTIRLINDLNMTNTYPNEVWGLTQTTVKDQVHLLKQLAYPNTFISDQDREYALRLMEAVIPEQKWGISGGVPNDARIALKNGWVQVNERNWRVNSFGHVTGDHKDYVISVMTIQNPTMKYGINTIEEISTFIWENL